MTNLEKFVALFPLKGEITEEFIQYRQWNNTDCSGAHTLEAALGKNVDLISNLRGGRPSWGDNMGSGNIIDNNFVIIGTEEDISFIDQTSPREVTFAIKEIIPIAHG